MPGFEIKEDTIRIKIIEDLFKCQFRSTYKDIFFDRSRSSDDRFRPFHNCVGSDLHKVDRCLYLIQDICDRSLVRIVKAIRVNADDLPKLLETIPDLKVIHLLRDPRACLSSLLQMRLHFDIKEKATAVCTYMKKNVIHFETIFKLDTKQTTTMFFESLAKNPIKMTKKLYDFIGVTTTHTVIDWVKTNMLGKELDTGTYSVKDLNSLAVSNKWRNQMTFEDVTIIDSACKDFYDVSGYFEVMKREDLNDSKIVHFKTHLKLLASDLERRGDISMNENDYLK